MIQPVNDCVIQTKLKKSRALPCTMSSDSTRGLVLSVDGTPVKIQKRDYKFSLFLHYFHQRKYRRMIYNRSVLRYDVKVCGLFFRRMIKYCKRRNSMRLRYRIFRRNHPVPTTYSLICT